MSRIGYDNLGRLNPNLIKYEDQLRLRQQEPDDPTFDETYQSALGYRGVARGLIRSANRAFHNPRGDEAFILSETELNQLMQDLPPKWADEFADATNITGAYFIREQLLSNQKSLDILARSGWAGFGMQMVATLGDPVELGIVIGATALLGPVSIAGKVGKSAMTAARAGRVIGKAVQAGTVAGGTDTLLMAADAALSDEDYSLAMYATAAIMSFTLAGTVDYMVLRGIHKKAIRDIPELDLRGYKTLDELFAAGQDIEIRQAMDILRSDTAGPIKTFGVASRKKRQAAIDLAETLAEEGREATKVEQRLIDQALEGGPRRTGGTPVDIVIRNVQRWESDYDVPKPMARTAGGELIYETVDDATEAARRVRQNVDMDHTARRAQEQNIPREQRSVKPTVERLQLASGRWVVRIRNKAGDVVDATKYLTGMVRAEIRMAERQRILDRQSRSVTYDLLQAETRGRVDEVITDKGRRYFRDQIADAEVSALDRVHEGVALLEPSRVRAIVDGGEGVPENIVRLDAIPEGPVARPDLESSAEVTRSVQSGDAVRMVADDTQTGRVARMDEETGRVTVELDDGSSVTVAPNQVMGMGAASPGTVLERPPGSPDRIATDFFPVETSIDPPKVAAGRARGGFAATLGRDDAGFVRKLVRYLVQDAMLDAEGNVTWASASEWIQMTFNRNMGPVMAQFNNSYRAWSKAHNKRWFFNYAGQEEFFGAVWRGIPDTAAKTGDANIDAAIVVARQQYKADLMMMKRGGVRGAASIEPDAGYVPIMFVRSKIDKFVSRFDKAGTVAIIRRAWFGGAGQLSEKLEKKLAEGFYDTLTKIGRLTDIEIDSVFSARSRADLEVVLRKVMDGKISDTEVTQVLDAFKRTKDLDAGKPGMLRRRTGLDYSTEMQLPDRKGVLRTARIDEMLETNAQRLQVRYHRQAAGATAMTGIHRVMKSSGETMSVRTQQLLDRAAQAMRDTGASENHIKVQLGRLDTLMRHIQGIPLEENQFYAAVARNFRNFNVMRLSGKFFVSQFADNGGMLAEVGWGNVYNGVPIVRQIVRNVKDGVPFPSRLAEEIQTLMGFGGEAWTNSLSSRLDFVNDPFEEIAGRFSRVSRSFAHGSLQASGLMWQESRARMVAAAGILTDWKSRARVGSKRGLPSKDRLALQGLEDFEAEAILEQIRKHGGEKARGQLGYVDNENGLGISLWDDQELASKFIMSVNKTVRRVILQPDIGQSSKLMTTWWGQIIVQFRAFPIAAYERHLLTSLQMHDFLAAYSVSMGIMFGGLGYVANVALNAAGKSGKERQKYLDEMITPKRIAAGAFQRSAVSSLLPDVVDPILGGMGFDPLFSARNSNLDVNILTGNPTSDMIKNWRAISLLRAPFDPTFEANRADWNAFRRLIPWQNSIGIQQTLDRIGSRFPEKRGEKGGRFHN